MKRARPEEHEVFGQRRNFQHPVLAPAPSVGISQGYDQMQENMNNTIGQFTAAAQMAAAAANPGFQVPQTPQGHAHVQAHAQVQAHVQAQTQGQQQQFQRLKVEDALSYLDKVKFQFGNQPQVYNDFLDIMKEFKSQSIDTPGVISRVSTLFQGHPELIMGFNTFLPPGYKIEVPATDPTTISVTIPGQAVPTTVSTGQPIVINQPKTQQQTANNSQQQHNNQAPHHFPHQQNQQQQQPTSQSSVAQQAQAQQPVEFNHAINYVNKIKNRFQGQPDIYKAFLEILHTYQKEQKNIKEAVLHGQPLSDQEVYNQVAKLFQNQEDLLQEFSQFLPDANGGQGQNVLNTLAGARNLQLQANTAGFGPPSKKHTNSAKRSSQIRRNSSSSSLPPQQPAKKKVKHFNRDITMAEVSKHGTFTEFAFFNKVRKAVKSQEVYDNFLRCLVLFNQEVISRAELVQLAGTFLGKFPELYTWFKEFLGYKDTGPMDAPVGFKERTSGELAHLEIDYSSCKRYGTSYRALPKSYTQPKCTGRSGLCREVLNDTWVSFPSWSEDTTFLGTRKTQYEEYIFRCEDERFELDVVLETNLSTIRALEAVQKKLSRMSPEEQQKFRLDSTLGGTSEAIHKKAIQRIYGDKAPDIIDGLKKTPAVAVPLVLKRLKIKEEEWRESQRQFNKIWREQNEKYYLKSLDHQGINFKQNDVKAMRSKSLINEIETVFDERQEQAAENNGDATGPHLVYTYQDKSILDDAAGLIIHHMKRQTGIHKEDKAKIKQLLYCFLPDLFFAPRGDMSDDEVSTKESNGQGKPEMSNGLPEGESDDAYNLFFVNNNWYIFFRLHQMLCERLLKIYQRSVIIAESEASDKQQRKEATAIALRLKAPSEIDLEEYYPAFLDMVRNLLDGNMEATSFEDTCREMFGVHAFTTFTIDKLIQNIVRQLHTMVTDETCVQVTELFQQEQFSSATGGSSSTQHLRSTAEQNYQKKAENILTDENCYKIIIHKDKTICRLSTELLDTVDNHSHDDPAELEKWNEYVENLTGNEHISQEVKEHLAKKPVFLLRTIRPLKEKLKTAETKKENGKEGSSSTDEAESEGNSPKEGSHNDDMEIEERSECRLSVNSYKMVWINGSEDYMYRRPALRRARQIHAEVARKLHKKFDNWHAGWMKTNISGPDVQACEDWLMGQTGNLHPCKTTRVVCKDSVREYCKYNVKYLPPSSTS